MKGLIRRPGVQRVLGRVLSAYIRLMLHTIRWRHVNLECLHPTWDGPGGAIGFLWHGRIPICLSVAPQWWKKRAKVLVSPSVDGEFIAQALARSNLPSIRASSAKKGDTAKARAVVGAFREALTWVNGGGGLVITPDGPRGPNERIAPGGVQIAKRTGAPVFLMGIAAAPSIRLDSWDRAMLAAPFGKGAVVWDGPLYVPADADDAAVDALIEDWSARLSAATRRAEKLVGLSGD